MEVERRSGESTSCTTARAGIGIGGALDKADALSRVFPLVSQTWPLPCNLPWVNRIHGKTALQWTSKAYILSGGEPTGEQLKRYVLSPRWHLEAGASQSNKRHMPAPHPRYHAPFHALLNGVLLFVGSKEQPGHHEVDGHRHERAQADEIAEESAQYVP